MSKILLDTNVLVYAKDNSSSFHDAAVGVFNGSDELYLTIKNLVEYYAVVTKGEQPMLSSKEAMEDLNEFVNSCTLLYSGEVSRHKLSELILKYNPKGTLIHDYEIAAIALVNGVKKIVTFNKNDFERVTEIEVIVPSFRN